MTTYENIQNIEDTKKRSMVMTIFFAYLNEIYFDCVDCIGLNSINKLEIHFCDPSILLDIGSHNSEYIDDELTFNTIANLSNTSGENLYIVIIDPARILNNNPIIKDGSASDVSLYIKLFEMLSDTILQILSYENVEIMHTENAFGDQIKKYTSRIQKSIEKKKKIEKEKYNEK